MSPRTLHRRLRAEGTCFRGILDAVRGERATALLRDPSVGIGEIAFVLGYLRAGGLPPLLQALDGPDPARLSPGRARGLTRRLHGRPVRAPRGVGNSLARRLERDLPRRPSRSAFSSATAMPAFGRTVTLAFSVPASTLSFP